MAKYKVTPVDTKCVDTDKAFEGEPVQIRSRIVARDFKRGDRPDLYAGTLPLEALKAMISIAASHSPEFSLMHVDVSRAYFHAKAQRPVLVKMPAEVCSGKDRRKIGLVKKNMYGTRDAASSWERDWQGRLENWERSSRSLFHNMKRKTSGLTHGDDFVRNEGESVGAQEAAGERVSNQSEHHGGRFDKEYQSAESVNMLERGIQYQHDPRHVDVLVESLGLENGNTVQTPIIDDVKDENPVWLDSEQISKYRSRAARCFFSVKTEQT